MKKGSLTVFFSLIMVAVMTLVFAMSECIRIYEMTNISQEYLDEALESAFSEYNRFLWENYKILGIDLSYGSNTVGPRLMEQRVREFANENSSPSIGFNYTRLTPIKSEIYKYTVLTDSSGSPVVSQGIRAIKDDVLTSMLEMIRQEDDELNNVEQVEPTQQITAGKTNLENAKRRLRERKQYNRENGIEEDLPEIEEVEDDPLDAFNEYKRYMASGLLSMVIPAEEEISIETIKIDRAPSSRHNFVGTEEETTEEELLDKMLYVQYLLSNYGYFNSEIEHEGIKYELEYLIAQKQSDRENLEDVVKKMLLIREGANIATILSNESLQARAGAIAATICSFAPELYEIVKIAIIAAWAYVESILDIRTLLQGGRISLVKNLSEWTSDVAHLSSFLSTSCCAKESQSGITYLGYLRGFLTLMSIEELGIKTCDVLENALNTQDYYVNTRVDNMLCRCRARLTFSSKEIFLSLFGQNESGLSGYTIKKEKYMGY